MILARNRQTHPGGPPVHTGSDPSDNSVVNKLGECARDDGDHREAEREGGGTGTDDDASATTESVGPAGKAMNSPGTRAPQLRNGGH